MTNFVGCFLTEHSRDHQSRRYQSNFKVCETIKDLSSYQLSKKKVAYFFSSDQNDQAKNFKKFILKIKLSIEVKYYKVDLSGFCKMVKKEL